MGIALIISLIALAVALPGCIADSLTVIEKLRSQRAKRLLKKSTEIDLDRLSHKGYQFDHIRPYSLGGADALLNLKLVCSACHLKKI